MPVLIAASLRHARLAFAAGLTTLLAACGGGDGSSSAPLLPDPMASFTQQTLDWRPCDPTLIGDGENAITALGERVKCTLMRAPLDYANPALGELQVALLKVSAGELEQRMGAILVNPGGPGGDGLTFAFRFSEFFALGNPADPNGKLLRDMSSRYDLVGFSPRGVGSSSALTCSSGELLELDNSLSFDRSPENIKKAQRNARLKAQACAKNPLTPHIHTDATARDMDLVRRLLGDARLNFMGLSYGTWLGAWYASLFPERVGRMLLDSSMNVAGSYDDATLMQEMGHERVMDEVILPYAARHGQRFNLDSNPGQIKSAILALPLALKTVLVTDFLNVNNSYDFDNNPLGITAAFGVHTLRQQLPQADERSFHAAIDQHAFTSGADNAQAAELAHHLAAKLFERRRRQSVVIKPGDAVYATVICNDLGTVGDEQRWVDIGNADATRYPLAGGLSTANPCLYWSAPVVTRPPLAAATQAGPLLMLQSRYDAETPVEGAQKTLDALPNASMIVIENEYSHGLFPYGESCVDSQVANYFLQVTMPPRTSSCAGKPLPADAPTAPAAHQRHAAPATSPYTDPVKAAEAMRRIRQMTEEATRRRF